MTYLGPLFLSIAAIFWAIGGNWVVGRVHLRNGRPPVGRRGSAFKDFTKQDWLLFLVFAALGIFFLMLAAAFGFFS